MAVSIGRRRFGAAVAATGFMALAGGALRPAAADSAKYRLRYGTAFPADHPGVKRIQEASAAIAKDTSGQVDLQVYPNSQLGGEPDMFSQTTDRRARLHVDLRREPDRGARRRHQRRRLCVRELRQGLGGDGRRPGRLCARASSTRSACIVMPKMLDNGYRNITTSEKQINRPDDLKGLKIRVPGKPALGDLVQRPRRGTDIDQFRRTLCGVADACRRRPGESARAHRQRQAVRGAEIRRPDRPHLGRPLHLRERSAAGTAFLRISAMRSPATSATPRSRSARTS